MQRRTLTLMIILFASMMVLAQGSVRSDSIRKARRNNTQQSANAKNDTLPVRFPVAKTIPDNVNDLQGHALDLKSPQNIVTDTIYNDKDSTYIISTKLSSGSLLGTPLLLSRDEYSLWHEKRQMQSYFRKKSNEEWEKSKKKDKFDFTDMHFDLGPAEKIFGPGGVRIKTTGNAELKIGYSFQSIDNPSLPSRSRNTNSFDFDEKINLSLRGCVGDKMNMDFNYNTESTFSYDAKKINLKYDGKEDEVIKLLEAGNVSFPTNSSLIKGASSLFGIRADLQFGKLTLQTVVSQKTSNTSTVSSKGGTQLTTYEIEITDYDENKHFFLAHYFRDNYDRSMSQLPTILSGVTINRIEVWITNKTSDYNNPRNIVAFTDIGEGSHISNSMWQSNGVTIPANEANNLYSQMNSTYSAIRDVDQVNNVLGGISGMNGGTDYEKLSNARLLSTSEYTLNNALGFISLKTPLRADEILAVAYEFTYGGRTYQVGEFSSDVKESKTTLFVKLLKPNACSPKNGCWDLMMKNVYSIGTRSLKETDFKLDVYYASDSLGTNITYLPEQGLKGQSLLQMLGLDRLDSNNSKENPNGIFDFIQGYTVDANSGRIFFPSVEPFGSYLRKKIGNDAIADKYVFEELYDSTKTVAKQIAEKDKFYLIGEYTGSSANVIQTGSTNIPRGSVVVTAGGVTLIENSDYQVDYSSGTVTILNQNIIDAGTNVQVSLESNTLFNMQRKTVLGLNWKYDYSDDFIFGGTLLSLSEKPLTSKVDMGSEPLQNFLWGFNLSWKKQSQWLTNMIDKLPFISCTEPSSINLSAEFARLEAGTSSDVQSEASYIDDFESTENGIDIKSPSQWMLAALPSGMPYSNLTNDIRTGYDRAHISWYTIDPLFTRRSSSLTPAHIKSDMEQLSNHYVREVYERELYPNKESTYGESSTLSLLNVTYYPNERGPYNLDTDVNYDGRLNNPEKRWGGITRQLTTTDFEGANIQYLEFWLLDPFIYEQAGMGGELYFNLGEVSEDILKDGKKFYENGLPASSNSYSYEETAWGRIPTTTSLVYAFDNNNDSRKQQDVGLNGLSSSDEADFPVYRDYLAALNGRVRPEVYDSIAADPAGDNYHYFRGGDYDAAQRGIIERYKYYNNTEGNSPSSDGSSFSSAAKTTPDIEDANQDFTMDEYENFFQYRISLRPEDMQVGKNYITDKRTVTTKLRNGNTESVDWYKFRIPINEYEKIVGSIRDFTSIRFIRMYMTQFQKPVTLRFATMQLVRGDWRPYMQPIASKLNTAPTISGELTTSAVSIEEHGDRKPVNYVLPPGITRILDPSQPQLRQDNEQALSLNVSNLGSKESRAVYKKSNLDIRQYERIQLYIHAEAPEFGANELKDNDLSLFIRLGSDYKSNYYEYEVPLNVTPHGSYDGNSTAAATAVWPQENMIDIPLSKLTNIKVKRNTLRNNNAEGVSNTTIYSEYDDDTPKNRISIVGSPSIGQIKVMMIGVRNNSSSAKSATVWVNEMRLLGFNNKSGWAAQGNLNIKLSDIGSFAAQGKIETAGFGGLEDKLASRRTDDYYRYSLTGTVDFGRFFPKSFKLSLPTYYSYTEEVTSPLYSPFDSDLLLDDVLGSYSGASKDSLRNIAEVHSVMRNFSISNAKLNIKSKTAMPYDPANLSISLSHSTTDNSGSTVSWENRLNWKASLAYNYASPIKTIKPFEKMIKSKSKWFKILKEWGVNPLPQSLALNSDITRSYHELQRRDLNAVAGGEEIPLTFSQQFYWNRSMSIKWDPTTNLKMSLSTGTNAEVEEPFLPVNKDKFPNEYAIWKDSVKTSLKGMGRPLGYQQNFTASYTLPFNKMPIFEWLTADASYSATYNWQRGNSVGGVNFGNNIANKRNVTLKGTLNFEKLYNIFPYLEETNKRFASSNKKSTSKSKKKVQKPKPFTKEIKLQMDTTVTLAHNLKSKKLEITARTKSGEKYKLKYKVIDENKILIKNNDSISVKVTVLAKAKNGERSSFAKAMQYPTRALMMVRNISFSYTNAYAMNLPGFMPSAGDMFGQGQSDGMYAPGLDFAFGLIDDSFLGKAHKRNWLLRNDSISAQATTTAAEDLQVRMTLEPLKDLKIDLNANWTRDQSKSIQFMYDGMPTNESGGFNMTTISIGNSFGGGKASNNYQSDVFDKFVSSLEKHRTRIEKKYEGSRYPASSSLAGEMYDPANGGVDLYSADVMIPAFLEAYSNGSGKEIFPSMLSMLPNWKIKYSGLSKLEWFKKWFKSVNIEHGYKSVYAVGSYSTYATYMEYTNGIGYVNNTATGMPIPSSRYNISTVSINESFSPLFGLDVTTNNNLTLGGKFIQSRVLNLSLTAIQMVETYSQEIAFNVGYKILGVKLFGGGKKASKEKESKGNDINLRADFSFKNTSSICRSIDKGTTQATSGNKSFNYSFTADYAYSKMLTFSLYFDRQKTIPLISTSSYPTTTTDFGISMKFSLTR